MSQVEKKGSVMLKRKVQFCESSFSKMVLFCESCLKKVQFIESSCSKMVQFCESC